MCGCFTCMFVCVPHACSTCRGQNRALDSWSAVTESCELPGLKAGSTTTAVSAFNHRVLSPANENLQNCLITGHMLFLLTSPNSYTHGEEHSRPRSTTLPEPLTAQNTKMSSGLGEECLKYRWQEWRQYLQQSWVLWGFIRLACVRFGLGFGLGPPRPPSLTGPSLSLPHSCCRRNGSHPTDSPLASLWFSLPEGNFVEPEQAKTAGDVTVTKGQSSVLSPLPENMTSWPDKHKLWFTHSSTTEDFPPLSGTYRKGPPFCPVGLNFLKRSHHAAVYLWS